MKEIELNIKGMHCKSCVILVKEALEGVKGVKEASVDLQKGKAAISFNERLVKEKQLIDAVKAEGYDARMC